MFHPWNMPNVTGQTTTQLQKKEHHAGILIERIKEI
jgi:hypothetical protein